MSIAKRSMVLCFATIVLFALSGAVFAASFDITLTRTSEYGRVDFSPAYMMAWSGDVKLLGVKIGEFNASFVKTTLTGASGYVTQYDLVIPSSETIPEFISIRTTHIGSSSGSDKGVIFATSPAFAVGIGATVSMTGEDVTITY